MSLESFVSTSDPKDLSLIHIYQAAVVVGNPFGLVHPDKGVVQQLFFLVIDIRHQQREKDVQPLDF